MDVISCSLRVEFWLRVSIMVGILRRIILISQGLDGQLLREVWADVPAAILHNEGARIAKSNTIAQRHTISQATDRLRIQLAAQRVAVLIEIFLII